MRSSRSRGVRRYLRSGRKRRGRPREAPSPLTRFSYPLTLRGPEQRGRERRLRRVDVAHHDRRPTYARRTESRRSKRSAEARTPTLDACAARLGSLRERFVRSGSPRPTSASLVGFAGSWRSACFPFRGRSTRPCSSSRRSRLPSSTASSSPRHGGGRRHGTPDRRRAPLRQEQCRRSSGARRPRRGVDTTRVVRELLRPCRPLLTLGLRPMCGIRGNPHSRFTAAARWRDAPCDYRPTPGSRRQPARPAASSLRPGGSTRKSSGIPTAFRRWARRYGRISSRSARTVSG